MTFPSTMRPSRISTMPPALSPPLSTPIPGPDGPFPRTVIMNGCNDFNGCIWDMPSTTASCWSPRIGAA
ncbi:hypothetical protein KTR9_3433 [Gordonia sp. KTR9]|nr:hypothetical protein KTR9_3433 [Gordonia sp. KTR9]